MNRHSGENITAPGALTNMSSQNDNEPVTRAELRAELDELRSEFNGKFDAVIGNMDRMQQNMDRMHDDLIEKMRDMQTEVLRAFHTWARPVEIRLRTFDDIQARLGLIEERVSEIERKIGPSRDPIH
jgi:hypothetical protein